MNRFPKVFSISEVKGMRRIARRMAILAALAMIGFPGAAPAQQPATVDFAKLALEAQGWLTDLVRMDTTNPPGNELAAAKYLATVLEKEGIHADVIENAPGRAILIARLGAGAVPDPSRALLLMGHTDVVGVDRSKWKQDPFSGATKDGYLWGRGTIDDKGPLVANLAAFITLKRSAVRLDRDVIFLAESDEEANGTGMDFAINQHWEKIAAGFAINEGGRTIVRNGKVLYVGVQASEKVAVNVSVIATGRSGHASIPTKENAVVHLAAAIEKIGNWETPAKPNSITRRFFELLAPLEDPEIGKWMRALETPEREQQAARRLSELDPVWSSMLRNSIAPTMLQAGIRVNVIPSEARAMLNVRLLPGELIGDLVSDMTKLVNDPQVRIEAEPLGRQPAPPTSLDTDLYRAIEHATQKVFPGATTLPMMSTWATDSSFLRLRSVECYGLVPMPLTEEEIARMHADDERVPIASIEKAIALIYTTVEEFVKAK
jgi:acetylornithine deacetylase/succinyl-diaminopimelate desuccinylase-like protein